MNEISITLLAVGPFFYWGWAIFPGKIYFDRARKKTDS